MIYIATDADTVFSVAQKCGVSLSRLIEENALQPPYLLTGGEALFISQPHRTYRVRTEDDISKICRQFSVSKRALLRANPFLSKDGFLYPGQLIVPHEKEAVYGALSIFGYTDEGAKESDLKPALPYLSALIVRGGYIEGERIKLPTLKGFERNEVPLLLAGIDTGENGIWVLLKSESLIEELKKEGFGGICLHFDEKAKAHTMANIKALHKKAEEAGLSLFVQSTEKYTQNHSEQAREIASLSDGLFLLEGDGERSLCERLLTLDGCLSLSTRTRIFCALETDCMEQTRVANEVTEVKRLPILEAKRHAHTKKRPMHRKDGMGCAYFEFPICTKGKLGIKRFIFEDAKSVEAAYGQLARCGGVVCRACEAAVPFLYMLSCSFAINGF